MSMAILQPSTSRICPQCGAPKTKGTAICLACELARKKAERIVRQTRICTHCGTSFVKPNCGKTKGIYCSRDCAFADPNWRGIKAKQEQREAQRQSWLATRFCKQCAASIPSDRRGLFCSAACRISAVEARAVVGAAKARERQAQAQANTVTRACRICGASFLKPLLKPGVYRCCSDACRAVAKRQTVRRFRQLSGHKMSDRARLAGVPYERGIGPISVCNRDRWTCQLCGVRTPRRLRGTYDQCAPEIDHIIPLSVKGSPGHVWANVQCACRKCNLAKSNKPKGQLRLSLYGS